MFYQKNRQFGGIKFEPNADRGEEGSLEDPDDKTAEELDGGVEQPEAFGKEKPAQGADTVAKLLALWLEEYEGSDDEDLKRELAFRILRMRMALQLANLDARQVKVAECEDTTLGFYVPETGEIAITTAGLDLPPEHYADVLVHEKYHKDGLMDESMAEIATKRRVDNALSGIYEREQRLAQETFSAVGIGRAIEAYDFEEPKRLVKMYLEVELGDQWEYKLKQELKVKLAKAKDEKKLLAEIATGSIEKIEDQFAEAVPDLYHKLKEQGFNFKKEGLKILADLASEVKD